MSFHRKGLRASSETQGQLVGTRRKFFFKKGPVNFRRADFISAWLTAPGPRMVFPGITSEMFFITWCLKLNLGLKDNNVLRPNSLSTEVRKTMKARLFHDHEKQGHTSLESTRLVSSSFSLCMSTPSPVLTGPFSVTQRYGYTAAPTWK